MKGMTMDDETIRRPIVHPGGTVATLHVESFDVQSSFQDITMIFSGAGDDPAGRSTIVRIEIASADVESLLDALRSEVTRSRQPQDDVGTGSAGVERDDSGFDRALKTIHPGVHYSELGWTREQFEEAAEDMSDMKDIWDHDELDVYNDLLKG